MRVLLVVPMAPQADGLGAIPKLLHTELFALLDRHEVTLVGTFGDLPGQAEAAAELSRSGLDVHFADRRPSPKRARRWLVRSRMAWTWTRRQWPMSVVSLTGGAQEALDRATRNRAFDVIAIEHSAMSALRYPPRIPRVLTEHEAERAEPGISAAASLASEPRAALDARDWRRWARFQPGAWRSVDLVQVFSRGDAAAIARRAPDVSPVIRVDPYGIEMPPPADPGRELDGAILFAGTFTHPPNREAARWLATEIMPAVRTLAPGSKLRIVGSAPTPEIRELAGPGIEVIGDAPSVEPHLEAASVVIAPVRSGGGMRMKVLEALARGKALVTTTLGAEGFAEFGPDLPFAIADEAPAVASAVAALLADRDRRRVLGQRARGFAQRHHSPAAWSSRLEAVYEEARRLDRPDRENRRPR